MSRTADSFYSGTGVFYPDVWSDADVPLPDPPEKKMYLQKDTRRK